MKIFEEDKLFEADMPIEKESRLSGDHLFDKGATHEYRLNARRNALHQRPVCRKGSIALEQDPNLKKIEQHEPAFDTKRLMPSAHESDSRKEITHEREIDIKKAVNYLKKIFNDARLAVWNCANYGTYLTCKKSVSLPNISNKYMQNISIKTNAKSLLDQELISESCLKFLDTSKSQGQYFGLNQLLKQCEKRCAKIMKILSRTYDKEIKILIHKVKSLSEHETTMKEKYAVIQSAKQTKNKDIDDTFSDYRKLATKQQDKINELQRQISLYQEQNVNLLTEIKNTEEEKLQSKARKNSSIDAEKLLSIKKNDKRLIFNHNDSNAIKPPPTFRSQSDNTVIASNDDWTHLDCLYDDTHSYLQCPNVDRLSSQKNTENVKNISENLEMNLLNIALKKISHLENECHIKNKKYKDTTNTPLLGCIIVDSKVPTKMKIMRYDNLNSGFDKNNYLYQDYESEFLKKKEKRKDSKLTFKRSSTVYNSMNGFDEQHSHDSLKKTNIEMRKKYFSVSKSIPDHLDKIGFTLNNDKSNSIWREKPMRNILRRRRPLSAVSVRRKSAGQQNERPHSTAIITFQPIENERSSHVASNKYISCGNLLYPDYDIIQNPDKDYCDNPSSKTDAYQNRRSHSNPLLNTSIESNCSSDSGQLLNKSVGSSSNFKALRSRRNALTKKFPEQMTEQLRKHSESRKSPFTISTNRIFKRFSSIGDYTDSM